MKRAMCAALVLAFTLTLGLTAAYAEEGFGGSISTRVWSKYLNQGGGIVHKEPVLWTDIAITSPWGLYLVIFNSTGLDGTGLNSDYGDEIDYYLGWAGRTGNVGYTFGVGYFDLYGLFEAPKGDLLQVYGEVKYHLALTERQELTPSLRFEVVMPPFGTSGGLNSSVRVLTGLGHSWKFADVASLEQKLWLIYDDGAGFGGNAAGIAQYDATLRWALTKRISADVPNVRLSVPLTQTHDARKFEGIIGAALSFRF